MRTEFGRMAVDLLGQLGITQPEFAQHLRISLSTLSDIEHSMFPVPEATIKSYIDALCFDDEAAARLLEAGRQLSLNPTGFAELDLLLETSQTLDPKAREIVEKRVASRLASRIPILNYSTNSSGKPTKRFPVPNTVRFVEIILLAKFLRQMFAADDQRVDLRAFVDSCMREFADLDFECVDHLPKQLEGAFAAIMGSKSGCTILLEEDRLMSAFNGVYFARHCVFHEFAHFILHRGTLNSDSPHLKQPQPLAKIKPTDLEPGRVVRSLVDSPEESEAELFATFFAVPWEEFYKGTASVHIGQRFGEQPHEIDFYQKFMRLMPVKNEIKRQLIQCGERSHPFLTEAS